MKRVNKIQGSTERKGKKEPKDRLNNSDNPKDLTWLVKKELLTSQRIFLKIL